MLKGSLGAKNVAGIELRKSTDRLVASRGPSQADVLKVVDEECEDNEELHGWSMNGWSKPASELLQQVHAGLVRKGRFGEVGFSSTLRPLIKLVFLHNRRKLKLFRTVLSS